MKQLSSDVGGTFVDVVLWDSDTNDIHIDKFPSTRHSADGIIGGIRKVSQDTDVAIGDIVRFVHGFTIATNAWLERRGARVLLLTTSGFRDVLEIANQQRPMLYSLRPIKKAAIVPRSMCRDVEERVDSFGHVVTDLEDAEIARIVAEAREIKPEAIAITFLFSYLNSSHEERLGAALRQALPSTPVYLSSRINPQIEEYARANTTATAAYVGPAIREYLSTLDAGLKQIGLGGLMLMRSDGGIATPAATLDNPATMLLSGPAGGVIAAAEMGQVIGEPDIVTLDMGGTSADFSLIAGGRVSRSNQRIVDQQPVRVPMIDIETISAGGGSIAAVDHAGGLTVGPHSAGAVPGPACYGRGGTQPTLTDAMLVLGMIDAADFAGGSLTLDCEASRTAIAQHVAIPLGIDVEQAALGMIAVACAHMRSAIRGMTVERGHDLRRFALTAFGGAGAIFAALMQPELNMAKVLVPPRPGVFAALGLLMSDIRHAVQAAWMRPVATLDIAEMVGRLSELEDELGASLARDGVPDPARSFAFSADMRYVGQFHTLTVDLPDELEAPAIAERFHEAHARLYGHADRAGEVEIVSLRAAATGVVRKAAFRKLTAGGAEPRPVSNRPVRYPGFSERIDTPVFLRADLGPSRMIAGPCIVSQSDTTILVLPGQVARTDDWGVLHITAAEVRA